MMDAKGMNPTQVLPELKQQVNSISKNGSMWLITDYEPKECYSFLMKHDFHFQTFIVSDHEYRVFISW